jgi:SAM-dependent methyltransferase
LARSLRLFRDFLHEQDDPERFYGSLAADSVAMVSDYTTLTGRTVLDVGAGPLHFAAAFEAAGARYIGCDIEAGDLLAQPGASAVVCSADRLAFASGTVDVAFSSNVLEHVSDPDAVCREMVRVLRPGGIAVVSFTNWLSPWGGHETSPWHWLGGEYAVRRYRRRTGVDPKNRVGETLFKLSVSDMLALAPRVEGAELIDARPRYWPGWGRGLLRVPGVREVLTWNLWLVLRRT